MNSTGPTFMRLDLFKKHDMICAPVQNSQSSLWASHGMEQRKNHENKWKQ